VVRNVNILRRDASVNNRVGLGQRGFSNVQTSKSRFVKRFDHTWQLGEGQNQRGESNCGHDAVLLLL
jgi:hypothetical protein